MKRNELAKALTRKCSFHILPKSELRFKKHSSGKEPQVPKNWLTRDQILVIQRKLNMS